MIFETTELSKCYGSGENKVIALDKAYFKISSENL